MGGHGGLNILPQKRWNVYNFDNREKVRLDEEAAAKEEQLKGEQARRRDTEYRIEQLRVARGLAPLIQPKESAGEKTKPGQSAEVESKPGHINLFEGIKIFDPIKGLEKEGSEGKDGFKKNKKMKKEETPRVVTAEDEKYRLGYGVAGKGVKLPWYLERQNVDANDEDDESSTTLKEEKKNKSGKKTIEELRVERLRREKQEKERVRALILNKSGRQSQRDGADFKDRRYTRRASLLNILIWSKTMIPGTLRYLVVLRSSFPGLKRLSSATISVPQGSFCALKRLRFAMDSHHLGTTSDQCTKDLAEFRKIVL
ncbi:hypothetical protein ACLB2K_052427 [Fragaria x ananassa]